MLKLIESGMNGCIISYLPNGCFAALQQMNGIFFTAREIDIIAGIIHLRGSSKIASILGISARTVETYVINIKRKIKHNSREGIIDFVERSGKYRFVQQHYQYLLITADFNKKIKALGHNIHTKNLICYVFNDNHNKEPIATAIKNCLQLAGIKCNVGNLSKKMLNWTKDDRFIYVISNNVKTQPLIIQKLQASQINPQLFTFIVSTELNPILMQELAKVPYISFLACENYYLTMIEVLKRLCPQINFTAITSDLKQYHQAITGAKGLVVKESAMSLRQKTTNTINFLAKIGSKNKWLIIILCITILIAGSNMLIINQLTKLGTNIGSINLSANQQNNITSYILEILTGYEHFVGRTKDLALIAKQLMKDNIVIIAGPSGIGKSTCAIEFAKDYKKHHIVRYFNAEFTLKIDQQYRELAQELSLNVEQQPKNIVMQLVNSRLSSLGEKILFIFDNVDNYDAAKEYLINVPNNVYIIITTRQPILISNKHCLTLKDFSRVEAEEYLQNSLKNRYLTKGLIQELVENTGTLPYDLKCVAAYLLDNPDIDHRTIAKDLGSKIKDKLFEEFIVSHDPIKQQAWKILQYMSELDPDFISISTINTLFAKDLKMVITALKKLESLSLITIVNNQYNQTGIKLHRKLQHNVQNSVKHHPKYAINPQVLINHLMVVLDHLLPEVNHNLSSNWQIARSLRAHVEKLLNAKNNIEHQSNKLNLSRLYYKLAKYYATVDLNYPQALKYALLAFKYSHDVNKKNCAEFANILNVTGVIYRRLGQTQEGIQYSLRALKIREKLYAADHSDLADSFYNLGMAYNQLGMLSEGLAYSQLALEMNQRLHVNYHVDTAFALNAVGICYLSAGNTEKSLEYLAAGLKMFSGLEPINHEKIAESHSNLAYNYNKLGDYAKSYEYAKKSLDLIQKAYPGGHPKTIYALNDLADALMKLDRNNIKQGIDLLHQALALIKNFNMEKHFTAAFVWHDLGWGYFKIKDYHRALEYSIKALNLRQEMYKNVSSHPELAESFDDLGDIYLALGERTMALTSYQKALDMYVELHLEHLPEHNNIKQKINQLSVLEITP